jgi:quercetin dioxygenase-like cupin family protein
VAVSALGDDGCMGTQSDRATVVTPEGRRHLPQAPLGTIDGVMNTVLWTDGTSMTGVLDVAAGHRLGEHRHRRHLHHMWVLAGEAVIAGDRVGPGTFVHIPPGVDHDIDATDSGGVSVYYSYVLLDRD